MRLKFLSSTDLVKSTGVAFAIGLVTPGCASESLESKSLKDVPMPKEESVQLQSDGSYSTNPAINIYLNTILENLGYDNSRITADHTPILKEFRNYIGMDDQGEIMGFKDPNKLYALLTKNKPKDIEDEHFEETALIGSLLQKMGNSVEAGKYFQEAIKDGSDIISEVLDENSNISGLEQDYYRKLMGFTCKTYAIHLGQVAEQINDHGEVESSKKLNERSQLYHSRANMFYLAVGNSLVDNLPNGLPRTDLTE